MIKWLKRLLARKPVVPEMEQRIAPNGHVYLAPKETSNDTRT